MNKKRRNKEVKKVLFLGLGAVGSSLAAQFLDKNYRVRVLCDINREKRYMHDGFIINDKYYNFNYITTNENNQRQNLIIIAVKYHSLRDAIEQLDGFIGEDTIIMSLLNGIDSEDIIAEKFGYKNLLYSFVYHIDAIKVQNIVKYADKGIIVFGEKNGQITERINQVKGIFDAVNIKYEISAEIIKRMWWKYMVNIGMNQTTAVLKAPYRALQDIPYTKELAKAAMKEVVQISQILNINLLQEDIDNELNRLMNYPSDGKSSMLQDIEAKRKTEVEMFSGKLCQLGEIYHIPTPVNYMFYNLIKSIETITMY